jgi:hypothetical protein
MAARRRADRQAGPGRARDLADASAMDERALAAIAAEADLSDETIEGLMHSMRDVDPLDDEQVIEFVERVITRSQ